MFALSSGLVHAAAVAVAMSIGLTAGPIGAAQAALVGTEQALILSEAATARDQIDALLRRADIRQRFIEWGVDPDEAAVRVASLSDRDAITLARRLEQTEAGQGGVTEPIGTKLIVVIILVFTDIAGMTDVFTFIEK